MRALTGSIRRPHGVSSKSPTRLVEVSYTDGRGAYETTISAPLLELQPAAIQDLHRTLLNDPPSGTEDQDLPALAAAYQVAVGAARRLLEWRQNEEKAEAEK